MELTPEKKDALAELINIGYGRAAGALSELTGYRITLEVPQVTIHKIDAIAPMLEAVIDANVASVNQVFTGPIAGNALLMLNEKAAIILSQLLTDDNLEYEGFDASAQEIITEVGNILLNACLGVFGNLLQIQVSFSVPRLHVGSVRRVLHAVAQEVEEQLSHGLMVHTQFYVKSHDVSGYLVIVLGITSLDRLLQELERWESSQLQ